MRYGYYPGCSLEGISSEYEDSIRSLFNTLNITLEELKDWICCGTLAAPSISRLLGAASPLWNVVQARAEGHSQLVTPCSACLYHFRHAGKQVNEDPELRRSVQQALGQPLDCLPRVIHPLEILSSPQMESTMRGHVKRDLSSLTIVCYYGCHISRPAELMQFDDPENPQSMDRLLSWAGIQVLDWSHKVDCCGAHFSLIKPEIVIDLCTHLYDSALAAGADAIVVACPMCHANLDTRQGEVAKKIGKPFVMPVLYFSQLLGYTFGIPTSRLGLKKHLVDPFPLMIERCGS
jgi:heterodisulfide reductase subunit B2